MNQKALEINLVLQQGETDCGVACLLTIIKNFGGESTLEKLREQSGTSLQGTSLLGLFQAAEKHGLAAEAFEVDNIDEFKEAKPFPCILHVVIDEKLEHYVVCFGLTTDLNSPIGGWGALIHDPAKGLETWAEELLLERWKSRTMLQLSLTDAFEKVQNNNQKKWNWFKELVREDLPLLAIASVLGIIIAGLSITMAIFNQKLIDDYLPNNKTNKLILGLGLLTVLLLAKTGIGYIRTFFLLRQSKDFNNRIATDFYEKLLRLPKTFFDSRKTGELVARMNDTRRIQGTISYLTGSVIIDILVTIISIGFIFTYSIPIGLVALVSIPLYGFLVYKYNNRIIQQQKEVMAAYARTESNYVDTISGIATIKATNRESFFTEITKNTYNYFQQSNYNLGTLANRYNTIGDLFNVALIVAILGIAAWMVFDKTLKLGEMMALLTIASGLIGSIARLATTNIQIQEAKVAFERMFEFANIQPEIVQNDSSYNANLGGGKFFNY